MTQETKSQFLINQERIMESRKAQDISIEERHKRTIVPAVIEPRQADIVETFDPQSGHTSRQIIEPIAPVQRIQRPAPITKTEILEMIESLRQDMKTEQDRFDHKDELDAERNQKRAALATRISELTVQLREAQSDLDSLNNAGSVREGFINFTKSAEGRIQAIATGAYGFLLDKIAIDKHEASFSELTTLLKESVRFAVDRLGIRFFTSPNFASLSRSPAEQINNSRIEATLEKVYTASEKIEGALSK